MPAAAPPPAPVAPIAAPAPPPAVAPALPSTPAPAPAPAPAKPTAKQSAISDLRKKAGVDEPPAKPAADAPKPDAPKADAPKADASKSDVKPDVKPDVKAGEPQPGADPKKQSPWKLLEQYKDRSARIEAENLELKKRLEANGDANKVHERATAAEKRVQELESAIAGIDYSQSQEFKTKYVEPYERAWKRAMSELKEISVEGPEGQKRPVTAQDMLELVNLPLGQAREVADKVFGNFADDVMAHRKEIRALFEQQATVIEDAKKQGLEKQKQALADYHRAQQKIAEEVKHLWDVTNETILADEQYGGFFRPIDGDDEGNKRLQKGYELADRAFTENPTDPKLSPQERQAIVKRHSALRNRAAAFGRLVYQLKGKDARIAELEKELNQYKDTVPGAGQPSGGAGTTTKGGTAMSQALADLRKRAQP